MKLLNFIALILVLVGALNWGLVGLFGINVVSKIFGGYTLFARITYVAVGVSAVWMIIFCKDMLKGISPCCKK